VLFGNLKGRDPMGCPVVLVNLNGICPVVPLTVMILGVKPWSGVPWVGEGGIIPDVKVGTGGVGDGAIGVGDGDGIVGDGDGPTGVGDGAVGVGDGTEGVGDGTEGDGTEGDGDGTEGVGDGTEGDGEGPGVTKSVFLHLQNFFSGFGGDGSYGGTTGSVGCGIVVCMFSSISIGSSNMNIGIGSSPPMRIGSSPPMKIGSSPPIKTGSSPPIRTGSSNNDIRIGSSQNPEPFPLIGIGSSMR